MGKTARWFRGLLGGKKAVEAKEKKGWGFLRSLHNSTELRTPPKLVVADEKNASCRDRSCSYYGDRGEADTGEQAVAVAKSGAATAQATVEVVSSGRREDLAAVKIQSVFRGYLAKRALCALKGLVKLQALVRGCIVRKQVSETIRCMHALIRVQARALAGRMHLIHNQHLNKSFSPATPEKCECDEYETLKRNSSKLESIDICDLEKLRGGRNLLDKWMGEWPCNHQGSSMEEGGTNFIQKGKIPEIDPIKPLSHPRQKNTDLNSSQSNVYSFSTSKNSTAARGSILSLSSVDKQSSSRLRYPNKADYSAYETADSSPQLSASSKPGSGQTGPFTPSKSNRSQSFLGAYSIYPNYMADTKSSKAKFRSQSAPKQRPSLEKCSSEKRFSVHGCGDVSGVRLRQSSQRSPLLFAKSGSKGYPGSGQLDRLVMPIG